MPKYFFNTADGVREVDTEGVHFPDDIAAREEAVRFAGDVVRDNPELLDETESFIVEVLNEKRELLFTVSTKVSAGR